MAWARTPPCSLGQLTPRPKSMPENYAESTKSVNTWSRLWLDMANRPDTPLSKSEKTAGSTETVNLAETATWSSQTRSHFFYHRDTFDSFDTTTKSSTLWVFSSSFDTDPIEVGESCFPNSKVTESNLHWQTNESIIKKGLWRSYLWTSYWFLRKFSSWQP